MVTTPNAQKTKRTDRRFRSGICKQMLVVAASSVLFSVAAFKAAASALQEDAGVVTEAIYPVEALGREMESGRPQPKTVQDQQTLRSGRDSSRTSRVFEAEKNESGQRCERNPLYIRRVDPTNYEYGCREIEEMSGGNFTRVGNGGVRTVFLAEYGGKRLAVKTLNNAKKHLRKHEKEVVTLDALRGHQNIVGMLGLCGTTVVTDFITDSFKNVIFRDGKDLSTNRLVTMAIGAAKGLQAIHEIGVIHMDMNPNQLLISETGLGMVNDFNSVHLMSISPGGQHAFCPQENKHPFSPKSPWRSPDNLAGELVTEKEDIYSFGMIFYSLMAGRAPYDSEESLILAHESKSRPTIDARWNNGFMEIVKDMWSERPQDRPSAREVVVLLEELLNELAAPGD